MAENTRLKDLQEGQKCFDQYILDEKARRDGVEQKFLERFGDIGQRLEDQNVSLTASIDSVKSQVDRVMEKLDALVREKSILGSPPEGSGTRVFPQAPRPVTEVPFPSPAPNLTPLTPSPRIDFPRFNGTNARSWILKCHGYFQLVPNLSDDQKITLASLHFEGRAATWFQYFAQDGILFSWSQFVDIIRSKFEDLQESKIIADFNKLKLKNSLDEYIEKFEELRSHMLLINKQDFTESYFVASFVSGLSDELQAFISMFNPPTVDQAIGLVKKQELTLDTIARRARFTFKFPQSFSPVPKKLDSVKSSGASQDSPRRTLLTSAQMAARREKGLCYNCDERFVPGHRCRGDRQIYMMMTEEEEVAHLQSLTECSTDIPTPEEEIHISLNAMTGSAGGNIIRLKGLYGKKELNILVDTGATHSFLDETIAAALGCQISRASPMVIKVANGDKKICSKKAVDFTWVMNNQVFTSTVRLFKLGGCHLVLGGDWLKLHSPIGFDYNSRVLTLNINNNAVQFQAKSDVGSCSMITAASLCKLLLADGLHYEGQLFALSAATSVSSDHPDLTHLLQQYEDVFNEPTGLPPHRDIEHHITLKPGSLPKHQLPYRYSHAYKGEIEKIVKELLDSGMIRHSTSPFAAPVLLVRKKDASWRMCIDYRFLNSLTIKHEFPIPVIDELLDELHGACHFSKIDLRSGYFQIRMHSPDVPMTAFQTHHGHFEFLVMPFGLCNAPATFQSLMKKVFAEHLRKFILVFFDDILVYSKSWEDHLLHLQIVLQILRENKLYAKRSKCQFGQAVIEYLGHIISQDGVSTDPNKISDMLDWPIPTSVKSLRGFLGLTGYYRKFVKGYGVISKPLTNLLKKDAFHWNPEAQVSFDKLKQAMTSTPVLALPDFTESFIIETDASGTGVGAVLMQEGRPIAFMSKALCPRNQALSIYEREFVAVVMAVQKWKQYLQGHHFIIKTDQQSLKFLMEQKVLSNLQQKWMTKLLGFNYDIQYKQGLSNKAVDALSRKFTQEGQCSAVSSIIPTWLQSVEASYSTDQFFINILTTKAIDPAVYPDFTIEKGIIRFKGRICVGNSGDLRQKLLTVFHDSSFGGHSGVQATYKRIHSVFYWPCLKHDIQQWIKACDVCSRCKSETSPYAGLLQPLPAPNEAWSHISMDFIEGLPTSEGKNAILTIIDRFTKYSHFIAISHPFTAKTIARIFMENVHKLHGLPVSIVTDRDKIFISHFWKEYFKLLGTSLDMSTAYHPQSDGQTERLNQCLENYLRCMVHSAPKKWEKWLALAEFWYNTNYHTALKMTPFEALYGYTTTQLSLGPYFDTDNVEVKHDITDRLKMVQLLRDNLLQAQSRMKWYADKHRVERSFEVGDEVYLKLQPFRQNSVALRKNTKLSAKYYGPFRILQKVGTVAYKLELPANSAIHPVFHVSLLKKKIGNQYIPNPTLPKTDANGQFQVYPLVVLDKRLIKRNNNAVPQILVQWINSGPAAATWEDFYDIAARFPDFDPWGQGPFARGG